MNEYAYAGKRGEGIRSDCYIEIKMHEQKKNEITIKSKVQALYGDSLRLLVDELVAFFGLTNAAILVEDNGALPFVLAARFEAAVKRLNPGEKRCWLPKLHKSNKQSGTAKDRLRRSRLYLPGNEPKFFLNAGLHGPDALILDLEDSVAPVEKDAAMYIVRNALRAIDFYGAEKMVRINQLPAGFQDLEAIIGHGVEVVLLPKTENAQQILDTANEIEKLKKQYKINYDIWLMPIIESAKGVLQAYSIATAHPMVCALAIGLEDYTADLGTQRTLEGKESFFARTMLINAAKAAGIQAIDTVFSDVADMDGLKNSVLEAKALGFEGKGVIHPRQIQVVHAAFAPTAEEIEKAKKIAIAFEEATAKGLGVVSLGSKMIDPPVVKRALRTIELAKLNGLLQ
ncbi:MAG: aldolase/citrate lyase family protein [Ignavibacteria bacterium]|nr:aldolase/citrate lyase family protein [Ignavibacteria bacterium]